MEGYLSVTTRVFFCSIKLSLSLLIARYSPNLKANFRTKKNNNKHFQNENGSKLGCYHL